jgi:hypothetical protein
MSVRAYDLRGQFFEVCDCYTICPCWLDQPPDDGRCTGVFCWSIDQGTIGDHDVADRRVVSVSFHAGHRDAGGQVVTLFVDDGATPDQFALLVTTFTGDNGGPLGELARLMGELRTAVQAPIELSAVGDHLSISVGRMVRADGAVLRGTNGEVTELHNGRLGDVLGPRADVGKSSSLRIDLGGSSASIEVAGRAAMRGAFRYESAGTR